MALAALTKTGENEHNLIQKHVRVIKLMFKLNKCMSVNPES